MKIEELTPLKELAFNYVKNTLKKDIKLEDIYIFHYKLCIWGTHLL